MRTLFNKNNPPPNLLLIDRDGVILKHKEPYILKSDEIEFVAGSVEALQFIASMGIPIAVVTNQSPISRGLIEETFVENTNCYIQKSLQLSNDQIKFYYCPHTAEDACFCRKPQTGMLEQACIDFDKKASECWMIGDHDTDMQAGINFGVSQRIHLLSGRQNDKSAYATDICLDLLSFVQKYFKN
ncbi:D-glycero-alpha-D-manno-heptose-1,7-bisphosphate 7-phosphatase [Aureispira anguillae]|uniref:D,D-heptose 1,7-bisphosphate phosphatase n=1 Tax=Aureispira anguillae TaxID=2864201 RepID=A0A915YEI2_9BACT|nr:HAD-IIIA family hydrolase [Aureispira anguillae]BDS11584.1 HAD-IIIA family hydrolase [Aureispira anguillae]